MSDAVVADLCLVLARAAELAIDLGLVPEHAVIRMVLERLERLELRAGDLRHVEGREGVKGNG